MIIVLKGSTPSEEITRITEELNENWRVKVEKSVGKHKIVLGMIGDTAEIDPASVQHISPWIESALAIEKPFKRVSREFRNGEASSVVVPTPNGNIYFGEEYPVVLTAGPCSVENEEMIVETAKRVSCYAA